MSHHRTLSTVACGALALLGGGTLSALATAGSAAATGQPTLAQIESHMVRTDNVLAGLNHAILDGVTPATTKLTVDISIADANTAAMGTLLHDEYTPGNAMYHQFISPGAFDRQFHVAASSDAGIDTWLASEGLRPSYVSGTGNMVMVRATTAQLGALMHTTFGNYTVGKYAFVANQVAPLVPAGLGINDVVGLNTLQRMYTPQQLDPALKSAAPAIAATTPKATNGSASVSYLGTLVPQDVWGAYDAPASDEGQGETAGMFGDGYTNGVISDLRVYEQRMGLPQVPVRAVTESEVTSPSDPSDNDLLGDDEWNLDTQAISSMAPKLSQLDMYFASTLVDADTAVMFSDWANDANGPKQMNASFGECDSDPTSPYVGPLSALLFGQGAVGNQLQLLADTFLQQAVAEGRTLFASSGDTGGSCPAVILPVLSGGNGVLVQPDPYSQSYPCDSAYATCVGGTVLTTSGTTNPAATGAPVADYNAHPTRVNEQAWAFGGGGPSDNIPEPSYQDGVSAITKPCTELITPDDSVITPGTVCRGVPDIASMSGNGLEEGEVFGSNSFLTNIDMMPSGVGGTSLSSPLSVGMWARIQAASPATAPGVYGGLGFANQTIYAVGKGKLGNYAKDFYDVTSGDLPTGNFYEMPAKGWDYTTGWGVFDVANFIRDVDKDPSMTPTHPSANADRRRLVPVTSCIGAMYSPLGNAYDYTLSVSALDLTNDTALDITDATLAVSSNGKDLIASIYGPELSLTGPVDAVDGYNFYLAWTYKGVTYFAGAQVDPGEPLPKTPATNSIPAPVSPPIGQVAYGDGVLNSDSPTFSHSDGGYFVNHTFSIIVPLSNVGSPSSGARLMYPYAYDTLPDGVFVPFAIDEATVAEPGQQIALGGYC